MSLTARSLSCIRGDRPVFVDVNFALEASGILLVTGRNGAGKSSLLKLLAGLGTPAKGELLWAGRTLKEDIHGFRQDLHYISHQNPLKDALTAVEHLRFWARFGAVPVTTTKVSSGKTPDKNESDDAPFKSASETDRINRALETFQLRALADVPVRMFSQGQRRRLTLARLYCQSKKLWLLDEPSVGLDQASIAKLEVAIEDHRRAGGMVVVVTHSRLTLLKAEKLDLNEHNPAHHDLSDFWEAA